MNRTTSRRIAPALVALALALAASGCSGESADESTDASPSPGQSVNAELCDGYGDLQKSVADLKANPLDTTGTPEEIQAQLAALGVKAATVKDNLGKVSALSDGPVGAAVGEMNKKADALSESLTQAVAEGQEEIGPKITAAQEELNTAYAGVTAKLDAVCPPS